MYRQPFHVTKAKSSYPSPALDELSDSGSDIITTLEAKRREIDEEIEAFKSRKEEEFKTFEEEFRTRKRQNTHPGDPRPTSPKSGLSNLSKKSESHGSIPKDKKQKADDMYLGALKPLPGPSKPSVSVDRVTINGMTTPPVSGTPPLGRTLSRSPTNLSGTPPRAYSGKETGKSSTPSDRENNFHGLFTPAYLPLLDTHPSSLPQKSFSPTITPSERSRTAPPLPSNSLPSALRVASGTIRKRKHVTFRLAHSIVVDPSSSYEETPTPSEYPYEKDLGEARVDSGIEMTSSPWTTADHNSDPDGRMPGPNNPVNEASFFPFDEEIDDTSDKAPDYEIVRHSSKFFWGLNELTLVQGNEDGIAQADDTEQQAEPSKVESPTFSSGSLPIDIVKPGLYFKVAGSG